MKWYKHYTDSLDDPFIQELLDEFSHLGYAVWFGIIEIICKETGKDLNEKFECSPKYLRRKLRTSQTKLREVFEYCQRDGRLLVTFSEKKWEFQIPKIAEIKDNYTKDLQVTGKKPSKHKEKEEEKEKEEDIRIEVAVTQHDISFEEFWDISPARNGKKIGKAEAIKKFNKLKAGDLANVIVAIHNYSESEMVKKGVGIKDPHRFLSNRENPEYWKEWMEPEDVSKEDVSSGPKTDMQKFMDRGDK